MNLERGPGRNPEDYETLLSNPVETATREEVLLSPAEIVAQEADLFTKLRGKAWGLAKVLILFTSLSLASSEGKKDNLEKPGYTLAEIEKIKGDHALFLNNARYFKDIVGLNLGQQISAINKSYEDKYNNSNENIENIAGIFLNNAKYFKDISGLNLAQEISLTSKMDPLAFINNAKYFKDIPGLNLAEEIHKVSQREFEAFLENAKYFKDIPGLNLAQEIQELAGYSPNTFFKNAKYFKDIPGLNLVAEIVPIAESHPEIFLKNAKDLKDMPGLNLGEQILKAKKNERKECSEFIKNAKDFKDISGLDLVQEIRDIIKNSPEKFLENAKGLIGIPRLNLVQEILQIAIDNPRLFLTNAKNLKDIPGLDLGQQIMKAKEIDQYEFLNNAKYFKDISGLNLTDQITQASELTPETFLDNAKDWKDIIPETELSLLTEKIFRDRPEMVKGRQTSLNDIKKPQLASTEILKKITNMDTVILLNHMVRHGLSEKEAEKIISDENKFLQTLIEIKSEPDHLGKIFIERALEEICLKKIYKIDELHERSNTIRFASVNKLTPAELYTLMVYGEEEIYTSSFNGLFNLLMNKIHKDNLDGKKLLKQVGQNKFRTFIKECASFNRLNEFLETMDKESVEQLLSSIVSNIDMAEDKLAQATIVADIFSTIQNEDMLTVLQKQIKLEYERVVSSPDAKKEDKIIYGILSGMFAEKAVVDETWTKEMADKFKLENLTSIKSSDLFNANNTNVQQYFFYDDEDGHASFKHFLNQYQNQPDWHITKKDHFVLIKQEKNGRSLEIYANYPESETEGPEAIKAILKEKNIETITVVHRGHSYHAQQTIDQIPPTAKIVSLGSCGGYSNIEQVLKRAPKAHILSTKGTGTMLINDPLLKNLNIEIMSGKNIEWPTFWENMQKKLGSNSNFEDYVPPHKNLGVMFLKTYFQELQK